MLNLAADLLLAVQSFRANRLRTFLTVLGLTMGVATLIGVMTIIQGAGAFVGDKIANLGSDVFRVSKTSFDVTNFEEYYASRRNPDITLDDFRAVTEGCSTCLAVGASASDRAALRRGPLRMSDVGLEGATANMAEISNRSIARGRCFLPSEEVRAERVCLIGARVAEELFPTVDPLGRELRVGDEVLRVVGVFETIGSVLGADQDRFIVTPFNRFRQMRGLRVSLTMEILAGEGPRFQQAQDEVRAILRGRRGLGPGRPDNFHIGTAASYIALWETISRSFVIVFIGVASISAAVGGIVIMNIMLVSVSQRTREIGVRRACGARRDDILRQFLTESVLQCAAGGVAGVLIGSAAALALRRAADFPAAVEGWVALVGILFAASVGLFFGIYPAVRAADLDPIEALREER